MCLSPVFELLSGHFIFCVFLQRELSVRYAHTSFDFVVLCPCLLFVRLVAISNLVLTLLHEARWLISVKMLFVFFPGPRALLASAQQNQPLPQTLSVLESTPQVRGLHTIIRY